MWVYQALAFLAKRELQRLDPKVVGITGSAGKTSTKEAIAAVLERQFKIKKNKGSMNSDFGVTLTVLDQKSAYSSFSGWISVLAKSFKKILSPVADPYEILVMEMGVDGPGCMDPIVDVVKPDVGVFLNVKNIHRGEAHFPNRKAVFLEKRKMCDAIREGGWAVLNMDDNFVKQLKGDLPVDCIGIGTGEDADLRASEIKSARDGLRFTLNYEGKSLPVHLPHILGECHVTLALSAIAVGFVHGMSWSKIEAALKDFKLPPGRMNPIEGKNGSLIIDSSYNAAPDTMEAALEVLSLFPGRKIAALGTMNELADMAESEHIKIGKVAADTANVLIAVGAHAKHYVEGAVSAGMSKSMIHSFRTSKEAGEFLAEELRVNDVVLAKGSQNGVRMEKCVKLCMQEPEQARHLLARQEPYWLTHL